jgi:Asp-tRNA(Asn)/Glu-tRNA(Gln) amidotransferase A subunit family amidase
MVDLHELSATDAIRRLGAGKLAIGDYLEACLSRIAAREPVVRAFTRFSPDLVGRRARRVPAGALLGMPVGVKDVLDAVRDRNVARLRRTAAGDEATRQRLRTHLRHSP